MTKSPLSTTLRQQLAKTFDHPNYHPPPLSSVALELQSFTTRDDVDVDQVVRLLERDQMLAGAVMRLVGSPLYAGRGPARSLRDAVLRLGIRTVRDAVFEAALKKSAVGAPEHNELMTRIARHGTATAYLTRVVCRRARIQDEQAFLCGLLHDVGFFALLFAIAQKKVQDLPPLPELWPEVDALHEQASRVVTKAWGLPGDLSVVVGNHHHEHTGASSRVAAVVNVADFLSARFAANVLGPPGADGVPLPACPITEVSVVDSLSVIGLDDSALDPIVADATPILESALA
ncbi:MAG TPA: HDOD domain-containing protein [Polyangiaceae bacterium]|jgi:HD-like signal output (HDOD) protein